MKAREFNALTQAEKIIKIKDMHGSKLVCEKCNNNRMYFPSGNGHPVQCEVCDHVLLDTKKQLFGWKMIGVIHVAK